MHLLYRGTNLSTDLLVRTLRSVLSFIVLQLLPHSDDHQTCDGPGSAAALGTDNNRLVANFRDIISNIIGSLVAKLCNV